MTGLDRRYPVLLDPYASECEFPDVSLAMTEPNGLLALGGSLGPDCLLRAYRRGIFPWYEEGQPILWWSPDPRLVLFPGSLRISRSLGKAVRGRAYTVTLDEAFEAVIRACSAPRDEGHGGTWITDAMIEAFIRLHKLGYAHSAETWQGGRLVGGLYGVAIGRMFFGESMFFRARDASKVAFVRLVQQLNVWGFNAIDCQMRTAHLMRFGAEEIPRERFIGLLQSCDLEGPPGPWRIDTISRAATPDQR